MQRLIGISLGLLVMLGLNLAGSVPLAGAAAPCSSPTFLSGNQYSSSSPAGCYLLPVVSNTSFLSLVLSTTGDASYDLYHSEIQAGYLSDWDRINAESISGLANYAFIEPSQGNHTVAVVRTGGNGDFNLSWQAVGEASQASNQSYTDSGGLSYRKTAMAMEREQNKGIMVGRKFGDRVIFPLEIGSPGLITVRAEWEGASRLALILNGPDRAEQSNPRAAYARRDGGSPLTLTYTVSQDDFKRGRKWHVSVVNFTQGQSTSQGTISIDYPASTIRDRVKRTITRADFVGNWTNIDDQTRSLMRIAMDENGQRLNIHTWGPCSPQGTPQDCDHGITTVPLLGNPVELRRDSGSKREVLTLWRLENGELRVLSDNHFTDSSGRDYVAEYRFRRAPSPPPVVSPGPSLLEEAEKKLAMQFNPGAALQKRIFGDGFVPNSNEFSLTFEGVSYAAQRAERLDTGIVRVYYVRVGDWGNVQSVQRPNPPGFALGEELLRKGQDEQDIQFNPTAALQKRIFADGFVPNSPEFSHTSNNIAYVGQRAEHLGNGIVRVYVVRSEDWGNIQVLTRPR